MPYRKRTYKRKTKRTYKKRTSIRTLQGVPSGIPKTRLCKLRYNEISLLTASTGVLNTYKYRANSIFDPNYTGTGHQPMGFDTWASLYNHYHVLSSKIVARPMDNESLMSTALTGIYLSDDSSVPYSDSTGFIEAKRGTHAIVLPRMSTSPRLRASFNQKRFFNLTKNSPADRSSMAAAVTADPAEEALYIIWLQSLVAETSTVYYDITIEYIVQFFEPKDLAQS